MEYIARSNELRERLGRSVSDRWTVVHHFSFDYGVSEDIRKNFEGFLRSLFYQLVEDLYDDGHLGEVDLPRIEPLQQWSMRALQEGLSLILKHRSSSIFILLDGLDEYQGSKWDLANFLLEMASSRDKLCIASRPNLVFDVTFKDLPTIRMQDWNTPAIDKMVRLTIQSSLARSGFYEDDEVIKLAVAISEKAYGVFLWARFAIDELRDGWSAGLAFESI